LRDIASNLESYPGRAPAERSAEAAERGSTTSHRAIRGSGGIVLPSIGTCPISLSPPPQAMDRALSVCAFLKELLTDSQQPVKEGHDDERVGATPPK
jgi:hypothetical protein